MGNIEVTEIDEDSLRLLIPESARIPRPRKTTRELEVRGQNAFLFCSVHPCGPLSGVLGIFSPNLSLHFSEVYQVESPFLFLFLQLYSMYFSEEWLYISLFLIEFSFATQNNLHSCGLERRKYCSAQPELRTAVLHVSLCGPSNASLSDVSALASQQGCAHAKCFQIACDKQKLKSG